MRRHAALNDLRRVVISYLMRARFARMATTMNDVELTLGRRIKVARTAAGLTQTELGNIVGVHRAALGLWETGATEPGASKLFALARATGQSLEWFAGYRSEG